MNPTEPHIDMSTIRAIAQLITERFDPEQVTLFGSYARGDASDNSDVDLLVVLRDTNPRRGNPVRMAIAERFVLPVDVVIRTPEAVEQYRDDPFSLIHRVLKEGVVLYERRAA